MVVELLCVRDGMFLIPNKIDESVPCQQGWRHSAFYYSTVISHIRR